MVRPAKEGKSGKQIGRKVYLAERGVKAHVGSVFDRLSVGPRPEGACPGGAGAPAVGGQVAPRYTLPARPTPLIGRERQLDAACRLLQEGAVRLLTLTGAGGVGKTWLALAVAERLGGLFPDGIWFVDLASLRDPALVPLSIAHVLHLGECDNPPSGAGQPGLLERITRFVRDRQGLLVLDTFEHLLPAAPMIGELLAATADLQVVTTAREPLHLRWEHVLRVRPLPTPEVGATYDLDELACVPAVALLVERARAADAEFTLTRENAEAVGELARRLNGLPLAIELTAARAAIASPAALLARLQAHLERPLAGIADVPERQRTLGSTMAWSYVLLRPVEQALYQHLSVFTGGWTLAAAEAVVGGDVFDALCALVDKNLVQAADVRTGDDWFGFLGTVRADALARLRAGGHDAEVRARHAAYYLALAERAAPALQGYQQPTWLDRLEREHGNMCAALSWYRNARDVVALLRMAGALARFWCLRGYLAEGQRWLEEALVTGTGTPPELRARALGGAAALAYRHGQLDRAAMKHEDALALYHSLGDAAGMAEAVVGLGAVAAARGDHRQAEARYQQGLALYRAVGNRWGMAFTLRDLGMASRPRNPIRARATLDEALALFRELGDGRNIAIVLVVLAALAKQEGDRARAAALLAEALRWGRDVRDPETISDAVAVAVSLADGTIESARRARLLSAADAVRSSSGLLCPGRHDPRSEATAAIVRAMLDEPACARAWDNDRLLALNAVVDDALAVLPTCATRHGPSSGAPAPARPLSDLRLSERELAVLRLVRAGKSSRQMGQELYIAERTVKAHVTTILNKLGVETRAQALAVAIERGLV